MSVYCNNIIDYKNMIITEAYFGKTPILLEIEKQIGVIRSNLNKYSDINRSEEVLKLNRLFEKQFGMEIFSLHVEKNNTINAYTIPVATRFDIAFNDNLSKKIEANQKDGYRFKPGNNLCIICNIYLGLLNCKDITDAEILAVILHELGHNFADAIYADIDVANKASAKARVQLMIYLCIISLGLEIPAMVAVYIGNTNKYNKKIESKTKKRKVGGFFSGIMATCSDFGSYVNEVISRLGMGTGIRAYKRQAEISGEDKKVKKSLSRQNEVIADKFAGIYGYGPEQASVLMKMEKQVSKAEKFVDKIPLIGKLANESFNDAFSDIYKFDCHPHVIQRLNEEIKTLKYELDKSDLDPKLLKAIKEQIKELEKLRDEATKINNKLPKDEQERAALFANINKMDPDAVDEEIEDRINKAFDIWLEEK